MTIERREGLTVGAISAAFVSALWLAGWTSPWVTPDTRLYLDVAAYPAFYFSWRLPFYGWLIGAVTATGLGPAAVIWLHLLLHAGAAILLYVAVRRIGAGRAAAMSLFLAALISQGFLIFGRGLHPEAPAASLLLVAISAVLLAVPGVHWKRYAVLAGAAGAMAILLRPILLPLVVAAPLLHVLASLATARKASLLRAAALLLALALPLGAYASERARHTGDFKIGAFGGFQMSGIAALMLSDDLVQQFPPSERALAAEILAARERAEAAGRVMRTRINSKGERSFMSAAAGYFDIYADAYDRITYGEIQALKPPQEPWISFDARLQRFALTAVRLAPDLYAAWVVGAASRLAGRMTVTNGPFLLAGLCLLTMLLWMSRRPEAMRTLRGSNDVLLLVAVVGAHLLATALLAVTVTYPASRYIDTAAALLPALPLYGAIRLFTALRAQPPAS